MHAENNLDSYKVGKKIGEGGFTEIFQVEKNGKIYALKKLKPSFKYDLEYKSFLENEKKTLLLLKDSFHFPELHDEGNLNGEYCLIMELLEGVSLEKISKTSTPPPLQITCQIILELCKGLEELHLLPDKIVHGDLKTENVMITTQGKVKLIDLSLKGGVFTYMPLDRLHHSFRDAYTDIYALGHIFYELLHQKKLFDVPTEMDVYFKMRELKINEDLFEKSFPIQVKKILVRCLNQDSQIRYSNISETKSDLEKFINETKQKCDTKELKEWVQKKISE